MTPAIHKFDSTGEAYDHCQWDEDLKTGDILLVESENVLGIVNGPWPIAISEERGQLHSLVPEMTLTGLFSEDFAPEWGENLKQSLTYIKNNPDEFKHVPAQQRFLDEV